MRLGCLGCFVLVIVILVVLVVTVGLIFLSTNIFGDPDVRPVSFTKADGYAAQQRLYEILQRESGRSKRREPVVITEAEANAFLSRHLEQGGLPLSPIVVHFAAGHLVAQGQTPLRNLFKAAPLSLMLPYVSDRRLDQPVWITVRARIRVDGAAGARRGNVDVEEFALGRQPL